MPVAIVSMLFSNNMGDYRVDTVSDSSLDIAASVTENGEYFLHIVNTSFDKPFKGEIKLDGKKIKKGTLICLAEDVLSEIDEYRNDHWNIKESTFEGEVTIPKASVCVVKL